MEGANPEKACSASVSEGEAEPTALAGKRSYMNDASGHAIGCKSQRRPADPQLASSDITAGAVRKTAWPATTELMPKITMCK